MEFEEGLKTYNKTLYSWDDDMETSEVIKLKTGALPDEEWMDEESRKKRMVRKALVIINYN